MCIFNKSYVAVALFATFFYLFNPGFSSAGFFSSDTEDECIGKHIKKAKTNTGAKAIAIACKRFPNGGSKSYQIKWFDHMVEDVASAESEHGAKVLYSRYTSEFNNEPEMIFKNKMDKLYPGWSKLLDSELFADLAGRVFIDSEGMTLYEISKKYERNMDAERLSKSLNYYSDIALDVLFGDSK